MSQTLVLDGYNIIGALDRYRGRTFDAARELLINDALRTAGWTGREVVVVFDAANSPDPGRTEKKAGGAVRVVYSASRESADDIIERLLVNTAGPYAVCTADFALQRAALAAGASRLVPREFDAILRGLPALTRTPNEPFRTRIYDRLSPETLRRLEEIRRQPDARR